MASSQGAAPQVSQFTAVQRRLVAPVLYVAYEKGELIHAEPDERRLNKTPIECITSDGIRTTDADHGAEMINLEGKQVRRVMRYSGGHPAVRQRCDAVKRAVTANRRCLNRQGVSAVGDRTRRRVVAGDHVWMAPSSNGFFALCHRRLLAFMCPAFDRGRRPSWEPGQAKARSQNADKTNSPPVRIDTPGKQRKGLTAREANADRQGGRCREDPTVDVAFQYWTAAPFA